MNSKELYAIREWAPLTNIIDAIPERIQRGLLPANVNITSVDVIPEFIALGSDAGIVFWYNRHTGEVQKLKAEVATRITCVKIVNSVEYMVAAGNSSGQVSVFQIQKELPPDLNLVAPCTRSKPIERYTIRDLHRSTVSCCEWSKNGMKLYSGDRHGVVVLTEFDFPAHLSKSSEILSEAYEIVQLSVHQKYLLVSTLYRSIVCQRNVVTGEWQITQIGKKDRKQLTDCGGTFLKRSTKYPLLICGRPGLRFWIADTEGNVERTLLFRDAVALSPTWEIPILNPKSNTNRTSSSPTADSDVCVAANNFCSLYSYAGQDSLVVTHDESTLYILNLDRLRVEAVARGFRKILDFCVCEKEIFILEGERSLLRLAPMPEKPNKTAKIIFNPSMPPPVPLMGAFSSGTFESPVEYEPEEEAITNAEECFELPPIEAINLNIPIELAVESPRAEQNRRLEIFNQISEMDFDQSILHTHSGGGGGSGSGGISESVHKKRKSRDRLARKPHGGIVEIGHAAGDFETAGECTTAAAPQKVKADSSQQLKSLPLTTQPTLMDASFCNTTTNITDASILKAAYSQHLPDLLSPDTMKKTIEKKAKSLAEELNLPVVSLAPITDEELRKSKSLASHPSTSSPSMHLLYAYPKGTQYENAAVQTTPRKKIYYLQDASDYSDGQPVDDDELYQTLRATTIVPVEEGGCSADTPENTTAKEVSLKFMPTQPLNDEIDSFLLDFRRACDPISQPTPASAESNGSSSEWEFLDN